jgi:segregation and condensation protein B
MDVGKQERVLINPSARNSQKVQKVQGLTSSGRTKYWFFIHCLTDVRTSAASPTAEIASVELSQAEKGRRIEAVLFLSREAVSSRKLAKLAGLADATEARTLIRQLNQQYEEDGRVFRIEEVAGGMTMLTRPQFAPWLRRLAHLPRVTKLSQSAMETLAVVAYRQPVLRADVEAIRGVGCSEVLKQLMESELVRISGRSEELGRPYLYGTTTRFLQIFGLRSADRLPRADWVNEARLTSQAIESNNLESSFEHDPGTSSEAKESTVKMSFSATALIEPPIDELPDTTFSAQPVRAEIDDDDDDFDDEDDDDVDDDDDDFDDDELEDDDEDDAEIEGEELADDDEDEELEEEEGEEDDWEEVDDEEDDDWDDDEDEEDDDWEEDDDEEEEWD